jgi:hypothetical protein
VNRTKKSRCDRYTQCETLDERVPLFSCPRQRHTSHWQKFDNCASIRHRTNLDLRNSIDIVQYVLDCERSSVPSAKNSAVVRHATRKREKNARESEQHENNARLRDPIIRNGHDCAIDLTYLRIDKALIVALVLVDIDQKLIHRLGLDIVTSNLGSRCAPRCHHERW